MKIKYTSYIQINRVITNIGYLSLLQIANLIIPLITYPYLVKVLGKDLYGVLIYVQAIMSVCSIVVNFGFNLNTTKRISKNIEKKWLIREIYSTTYYAKLLLLIISGIIAFLIYIPQNELHNYSQLYVLSFWICIYECLFPIWFFQGIEKMKYISILTIVAKLLSLILIFFLIKEKDNYIIIPIINGLSSISIGFFSILIIKYRFKIGLIAPNIRLLKASFYESSKIFTTSIIGIIKDKGNTIIIGQFGGFSEVTEYDLVDKIVNILSKLFYSVGDALFPFYNSDKNSNQSLKVIRTSVICSIGVYLIGVFTIDFLVTLVFKQNYFPNITKIFAILGLSIVFRNLSHLYGTVILISKGETVFVIKNMIRSTLIYFTTISILFLFGKLNLITICWALALSVGYESLDRYYKSLQ